jgi:Family of unknown function (DUF6353)
MKLIPTALTRTIGRQVLTLQKNSPRLMFVGGIVGIGVSTVLACRATLKLEATLVDFKTEVDEVKGDGIVFDRKDVAYVYGKNLGKLARMYAPSIVVGGVSVGLLTGSHVTLSRRNAALTAAYSTLQMSFDQYVARVRDEIGAEREELLRRGITNQEVSLDGKKKTVPFADPNGMSPYAKVFDELNRNWKKNPELNRLFITCQQNYYNNVLQARGHVFLNEVYEALGFDHTSAGSVVGWVIDRGENAGDNYIDFGMFEAVNSAFINGYERSIWLDFNVDGVIYDKI